MTNKINIIGAGLAGSEAAWQVANLGIEVDLYEMRMNGQMTNAHKTDKCAELVCSNSFRNDDVTSAIGLLHQEMRMCNSLIMEAADANSLPAGNALAMDRDNFSAYVHDKLMSHPLINIKTEEVKDIVNKSGIWIIATGPLTSDSLTQDILKFTGSEQLAFFDAIAPIIYRETIDFNKAWFQSRYNKTSAGGDGKDYINCPLDKEQYYAFIDALLDSPVTEFKEWEKNTPYFNGCLPIEIMAERGRDTLRFGPMKPVGLDNPFSDQKPYAVVQLRQDNQQGTLFNMVGFQTKLKYDAQKAILRMIPGLENAEFARLGGLHRNTFINSRILLDPYLQLKSKENIKFAGQITGVEGYVESAAIGLLAGRFSALQMKNQAITYPPRESALGSLIAHITSEGNPESFQPMNINFGLFPALENNRLKKQERYKEYSNLAIKAIENWLNT